MSGDNVIDAVRLIAERHVFSIILYASLNTFITIMLIWKSISKKRKYMLLKKDVINLGFWQREYVLNEDDFVSELLSENMRLESELKVVKKDFKNLKVSVFIVVLIFMIIAYFKNRFSD